MKQNEDDVTAKQRGPAAKPFRPASADWNFYRDLSLLWPLLLGSAFAGAELFDRSAPLRLKVELIVVVIVILLLTREKRLMVGGISLCFCLYSIYVFFRYRFVPALAVVGFCGAVVWIIVRFSRDYQISYEWPSEIGGFEMLIMICSMLLTFTGWYFLLR